MAATEGKAAAVRHGFASRAQWMAERVQAGRDAATVARFVVADLRARALRSVRESVSQAKRRVRGYEGASTSRTSAGWSAGNTSANTEIGSGSRALSARSHDLARNNPHVGKGLSELVTALVGTGLRPRGVDPAVLALFEQWSKECDTSHDLTFYGKQLEAARAMFEGGEVLTRARWRRATDPLVVPLQLESLEGDYCPISLTKTTDAGRIVQGIEFDAIGRRRAYHLYGYHPGDTTRPLGVPLIPQPVPADEIAHLWARTDGRPGQVRGVPWFSGVIDEIRDLDDIESADRVRRRAQACLAAFVTNANPDGASELGMAPAAVDSDGNPISDFSPGMVVGVRDGTNVTLSAPVPSPDHVQTIQQGLRNVAAGARMSYEALTGDLSQVNYSSIRYGTLSFAALMTQLRELVFIPLYCDRVWGWFLDAAVLAGRLSQRQADAARNVKWSRPRVEDVDRKAAAEAQVLQLANGFRTFRDIIEQDYSGDYDAHLDDLAREAEDIRSRGVTLPWLAAVAPVAALAAPVADGADPAAVAEAANTVADTALNGAQVASLLEILQKVTDSLLPADAAETIILLAFPSLDPEKVKAMVASADAFAPPPAVAA